MRILRGSSRASPLSSASPRIRLSSATARGVVVTSTRGRSPSRRPEHQIVPGRRPPAAISPARRTRRNGAAGPRSFSGRLRRIGKRLGPDANSSTPASASQTRLLVRPRRRPSSPLGALDHHLGDLVEASRRPARSARPGAPRARAHTHSAPARVLPKPRPAMISQIRQSPSGSHLPAMRLPEPFLGDRAKSRRRQIAQHRAALLRRERDQLFGAAPRPRLSSTLRPRIPGRGTVRSTVEGLLLREPSRLAPLATRTPRSRSSSASNASSKLHLVGAAPPPRPSFARREGW